MEKIVVSKELSGLLIIKDNLVKEGRSLSAEIEKLESKRNKCGMQIQKVKDKIIPLAQELIKPLEEFHMLTQVNLDKKGKIVLSYVDQIEEFKKQLKQNENTTDEPKS